MSDETIDIMLRVLLGADSVRKFEGGMTSIEQALEGVDDKSLELAETLANNLEKSLKGLDDQFSKTKKNLESFKQGAEKLGQISQTAFVASSALVGSIYLSAKTEADRIIEAGGAVDQVTLRWIAANERLEQSQQKIGRASMSAVVPLMEKAADLAEKASNFVEDNPELVSAALKIGLWTAGVSAMGIAVSKGIRLYADLAYLSAVTTQAAAAAAMKSAAADQLRAAGMQKGNSVSSAIPSTASKFSATVQTITIAATMATIAVKSVDWVLDKLELPIMGEIADAQFDFLKRIPEVLAGDIQLNDLAAELINMANATAQARREAEGATPAIDQFAYVTGKEAEGLEILSKLAQDQAEAERKYADERKDILIDSSRALEQANRTLESSLSDIAASLSSSIGNIKSELKKSLADLSADFAEANLQAEREYQQQRADIIADGEAEIARIQQQAQKDLEDLEREHARNLAGATNERDALSLVDENQNYQDRKAEIEQNAQLAIEQARANTAAQLAEAARSYEEQRAQRLAEYEKQKAEAKAQAEEAIIEARAKAAEAKKQAEEKYKEEKEEVARKQAEQLEDLRRHAENERRERVQAANQAITDLGGALNAEAELRRKYYDVMLADTNNFLSAYSATLSSVPTSSGPSSSTMSLPSGSDVLRSMVGSKLTQESITPFGGDGSIVWNDYRTFEADVSLATRNAIKMDTLQTLDKAMEKAKRSRGR